MLNYQCETKEMKNKKTAFIIGTVGILMATTWIGLAIKDRQEAKIKNIEASWDYFPAEKIYIGQQLCEAAGTDPNSGRKSFKCPDGKIYVHKDWY